MVYPYSKKISVESGKQTYIEVFERLGGNFGQFVRLRATQDCPITLFLGPEGGTELVIYEGLKREVPRVFEDNDVYSVLLNEPTADCDVYVYATTVTPEQIEQSVAVHVVKSPESAL